MFTVGQFNGHDIYKTGGETHFHLINIIIIVKCGVSVAYRGGKGVWGVQPPRNSEGPTKNRAKLKPDCENLKKKKNAEFRTPTHQDVRKKGSKILKLRRFAFVLH